MVSYLDVALYLHGKVRFHSAFNIKSFYKLTETKAGHFILDVSSSLSHSIQRSNRDDHHHGLHLSARQCFSEVLLSRGIFREWQSKAHLFIIKLLFYLQPPPCVGIYFCSYKH